MFMNVTRQYQIRSGLLLIKLALWWDDNYQSPSVTMDVIKDIELNYGYEDQEDLLTFYPNTVKFTFDDIDKRNYFALKNSLSNYNNTLPQHKSIYGGVEIYLNNTRKFSGFIDPLTLDWKEYDRTVVFEAICYTSQLKDITVDRNNYINTDGAAIGENNNVSMLLILYGIYKQVWSDFEWNLYDVSAIDYIEKGVFCKHDWNLHGQAVFPAADAYADWSQVYAGGGKEGIFGTFMNYDSTRFFGANRVCNSYADMIRILALQFGAIIGVEDVNKVYFMKRFGLNRNACEDVTDSRLKLEKSLHLNPIRGVQITNDWNGVRTFDYGDIEKIASGELKYPDKVLQLNTYIGSYRNGPSQGTCIEIYDQVRQYPVWGICWDPAFGGEGSAMAIHELVGKWTRENRKTAKERVEIELIGINYSMAKTYVVSPDSEGINKVYFRPMQMSKNLMKDKTKITGLEI